MARTTYDSDAPDKNSTLAPGTQARLKEKAEREDAEFRRQDDMLRRQATEGCRDQETVDAVLALGGDAIKSSPVREQVLPAAEPGLTTTTGAYRSPIDPTTAAVPASEHSRIAREVGGTPTVGSDGHGQPEERWAGVDTPAVNRVRNLPTQEERTKREAEEAEKYNNPNKGNDPRQGDVQTRSQNRDERGHERL